MKSVLVTGGTIRLGKAIAERLRTDGWRVLTSSHRADAGADIVADLSEPMGAEKLYAAALQMLDGNPPDALVNNAALFTGDDAAITAVNFEAPKKLTMMMAGRETGMGAVVNVLDAAAGCSSDSRALEGTVPARSAIMRIVDLTTASSFARFRRLSRNESGSVPADGPWRF